MLRAVLTHNARALQFLCRHIFTARRRAAPAAVGVAAAVVLLAGCSSPSPPATPRTTATPATPSPTALFIPTPPPSAGPVAPGVTLGQPPITYAMPAGFSLTFATDQEVKLATSQGVEQILFAVDPSQEDTSHALGTVTVGGERGYVLQRGDDGSGLYSEVVVLRHRGTQYELSCIGFHGYDSARIQQGCSGFTSSLAFTR